MKSSGPSVKTSHKQMGRSQGRRGSRAWLTRTVLSRYIRGGSSASGKWRMVLRSFLRGERAEGKKDVKRPEDGKVVLGNRRKERLSEVGRGVKARGVNSIVYRVSAFSRRSSPLKRKGALLEGGKREVVLGIGAPVVKHGGERNKGQNGDERVLKIQKRCKGS